MGTIAIYYIPISYASRQYDEAVVLREKISRNAIGLSFSPNKLAKEETWLHFVAVHENSIVATSALIIENAKAKICRVAVRQDLQGQGIGKAITRYAEEHASQHGIEEVYLHARDSSIPFYLHIGYQLQGEPFIEDTIPHQRMHRFYRLL